MAHVDVVAPDLALEEPTLVEGLPGMGLIGKLVADHLREEFEMTYYAGVHCEGVPPVAAYRTDDPTVRPPVQVYAADDRDLLVLVSDIPVSPSDAPEFADCITDFLGAQDVTPVFTSGFDESVEAGQGGQGRALHGVATGDGEDLLAMAGIEPPHHAGIVTGSTGALLERAGEVGLDGVGLLVESTDELPDVEAALAVIEDGIEPITGLAVDTRPFVDGSIEMSPIAESVLENMQAGNRAEPTPTFH